MSMQSWWSIPGYGIDCDAIEPQYMTKTKVEELLTKAPKTKSLVDKWRKEAKISEEDYAAEDIYESYETDDGDDGYSSGPIQLMVDAIGEIEGVSLTYRHFEWQHKIFFEPFYPWQKASSNDKKMTPELLDGIFLKYFGCTGDYQSVEYAG